MEKTTDTLLGLILLVLSVFLIVTVVMPASITVPISQPSQPKIVEVPVPIFSGIEDMTRIGSGVTTGSTSIPTHATDATGTEVFASSSHIAYRRMQNTGESVITCNLDGEFSSATSSLSWGEGIVLATSGTDSIFEQYLGYWGAVRCMATSVAGVISTIQY